MVKLTLNMIYNGKIRAKLMDNGVIFIGSRKGRFLFLVEDSQFDLANEITSVIVNPVRNAVFAPLCRKTIDIAIYKGYMTFDEACLMQEKKALGYSYKK